MNPPAPPSQEAAPACTAKYRRSRTPVLSKEWSASSMTDAGKRRLDLATVRVIGLPEVVDQVVDAITTALPSADPSQPYPSRKNPGHVRVYVEVSPE